MTENPKEVLGRLYSVFGNAVFVCIPLGEKGPRIPGWQSFSLAHTRTWEYGRGLEQTIARGGNVGVRQGESSENLVAIDIDDDAFIEPFLALNPELRHCTRTRGARGCQIHLRMRSPVFPRETKSLITKAGVKFGEWRGGTGQSVIWGKHPNGNRYSFLVDRPVVSFDFKDIHWPEDLVLPWQGEAKTQSPRAPAQRVPSTNGAAFEKRIEAYLAAIPGAVSHNGGHTQTLNVATALVIGFQLGIDGARPWLERYNSRCEPPWDDKALAHKLEEAEANKLNKPMGYLLGEKSQVCGDAVTHKTKVATKSEDNGSVTQGDAGVSECVTPGNKSGTTSEGIRDAVTQENRVAAYYDSARKEYLIQNGSSRWLALNESQFKLRMRDRGYSTCKPEKKLISPAEEVMLEIQDRYDVHFSGPLSGRDAGFYEENGLRILVTSSPKMIDPKEGEFPTIDQLIENMLGGAEEPWGESQLMTFYGWLQVACRALKARKFHPGQALALAGPVDSGKSLVQSLVTEILGGRSAKAALFLQGRTDFNSELFGAEHLMLEDENASTSHHDRLALAAQIKGIAVNRIHPCHGKRRDIVNISPWWRLTISLNDRPDRLLVLPHLSDDIADKIILLQATKAQMPMPTETAEERDTFWKTLISEIPAFLWWLDHSFVIQPEFISSRFGVREFHHPGLLEALNELSPSYALLTLIDQADIWEKCSNEPWEGTALELRALLMSNSRTQRDANRLLDWTNACGQYLADLEKSSPDRVRNARNNRKRSWLIYRIF